MLSKVEIFDQKAQFRSTESLTNFSVNEPKPPKVEPVGDDLDSQGNPLLAQDVIINHKRTISIGCQTLPLPEKKIQPEEIPTRKDGAKYIEPR